MKESPIIFSTTMVQAVTDGRKTMTRRIIKPQPKDHYFQSLVLHATGRFTFAPNGQYNINLKDILEVKCPYGQPGDLLWVREKTILNNNSNTYWPVAGGYVKTANYEKVIPSIHMPKAAARVWLRITDIRVERLHDIKGEDAAKEGTEWSHPLVTPEECSEAERNLLYKHSFENLWNSMYGCYAWARNPWVWVLSFEYLKNHKQ